MKIMYLTDVGLDTPNSNNHLVISMISDFLKAGHYVYLVQSHSTGEYKDIPEEFLANSHFDSDTINKPVVARSDFVKRYLSAIKYEFDARKKWKLKIADVDIVILQSHYTAVYAAFLLKRYKKKVVFNIYDIFPGEAYTNGNIKSKVIYNFFSNIQKYLYKHCDAFFTLTRDTKNTLIELGVNEKKIDIIPNWFDETKINAVPFNINSFAKENGLHPDVYYVQYAGQIGVSYDFDFILDVAKEIENRKDIVFQLVGEGLCLQRLKDRVKSENITNVQFIPWQPLNKISDLYSACTLELIPLRKDVIKNSYPSKILPLMACRRVPVISVEKDSFFYKEINEKKIGVATPLGDKKAFVHSILFLIDNDLEREKMQDNAYRYVYKNFTSSINTQKMLKRFEKMVGKLK